MAPKKSSRRRSILKFRPVARNCGFCKTKTEPSYKNYTELEKFITDRARILGKGRTGVCAKHQRKLGQEIKRARFLGLLVSCSK